MIVYSGLGFLTVLVFIAPLLLVGVVESAFGIDLFAADSRWTLHAVILIGALVTFATGRHLNRKPIEETVYEKTGSVQVPRPRHTFYFVRMEYWGPIGFLFYAIAIAAQSGR